MPEMSYVAASVRLPIRDVADTVILAVAPGHCTADRQLSELSDAHWLDSPAVTPTPAIADTSAVPSPCPDTVSRAAPSGPMLVALEAFLGRLGSHLGRLGRFGERQRAVWQPGGQRKGRAMCAIVC